MLPVTDSNIRADALVQHVLPHYPIGEVTQCHLHARGLNDTYKVEASGNDAYFLRIYVTGIRTREQIDIEIGILQHLQQCGVNVSVPVARTDGQILTPLECAEGQRWAVLFTAAPGKEVTYKAYTEELAGLYGASAAAIHDASDSFAGDPIRPALDLSSLLTHPLSLLADEISHRAADVSYIRALGARLQRDIETAAALETGFCHGDLHGQNACEQDRAFTFYDFDCSGWGYRAYDLAVFPWAFAVGGQDSDHIATMARAFLSGYLRRRAFSSSDIAAIPAFVAIRQFWLLGMHIERRDRFGWGWRSDGYYDHHLKVLRDWEENFLDRPVDAWLMSDIE